MLQQANDIGGMFCSQKFFPRFLVSEACGHWICVQMCVCVCEKETLNGESLSLGGIALIGCLDFTSLLQLPTLRKRRVTQVSCALFPVHSPMSYSHTDTHTHILTKSFPLCFYFICSLFVCCSSCGAGHTSDFLTLSKECHVFLLLKS